jgi:hypothetical protein
MEACAATTCSIWSIFCQNASMAGQELNEISKCLDQPATMYKYRSAIESLSPTKYLLLLSMLSLTYDSFFLSFSI